MGGMQPVAETQVIEFRGDLVVRSFAEFARHRAARLALSIAPLAETATRARYAVTGPADLIDAFEMALSLGPADSLVIDVLRLSNAEGTE